VKEEGVGRRGEGMPHGFLNPVEASVLTNNGASAREKPDVDASTLQPLL
jgi:hypothetical protein